MNQYHIVQTRETTGVDSCFGHDAAKPFLILRYEDSRLAFMTRHATELNAKRRVRWLQEMDAAESLVKRALAAIDAKDIDR